MELDLNKALLFSFLSILALSFPSRAAAVWPPGHNLSVAADASPPCGVGEAGCRIADLQPELEGIADPGTLGASPAPSGTGPALDSTRFGCGRDGRGMRYIPCVSDKNKPPRCSPYCGPRCPTC